jgi:hypothetical protein
MDGRLLAALREWFGVEWGVSSTVFVVNEHFTHQVELVERAGLTHQFDLVEPDKPGTYLVYG